MINYEIAQLINEEIKYTNMKIIGVHGNIEITEGVKKLSFRLRKYQIKQENFSISKIITQEMILGIDFLIKYFLELDFANKRLVCRADNETEIVGCNFICNQF